MKDEKDPRTNVSDVLKDQVNKVLQALEDAEAYGTVETGCPHGCIVEPDGMCPHGYGSPLLGWGC